MSTPHDDILDRVPSGLEADEKPQHTDQSKGTLLNVALRGTAEYELNVFERKAELINMYASNFREIPTNATSELDKFGFGRYQQCIWLLCGFGYFLDLAWSQGVGLMATAIL